MEPRELTFEQVVETGRPARHVSARSSGLHEEWTFEQGRFWLVFRDGERTYSMRQPMMHEVPRTGWHHEDGCDCRYCAGAREESETRRE